MFSCSDCINNFPFCSDCVHFCNFCGCVVAGRTFRVLAKLDTQQANKKRKRGKQMEPVKEISLSEFVAKACEYSTIIFFESVSLKNCSG